MCGSGRAGHLAGTGIAYESRPVILGKVDAQQITGAAIISRYGMAQMHGHDLTQQSILFRTVQQSRRRQSSSLARSRYGPECHGTQRGDRPGLHGKPGRIRPSPPACHRSGAAPPSTPIRRIQFCRFQACRQSASPLHHGRCRPALFQVQVSSSWLQPKPDRHRGKNFTEPDEESYP